jgi:hypothetical protein
VMDFPLWVIVMLRCWIAEGMSELWRIKIERVMLVAEGYGCEWFVQRICLKILKMD